MKAKERLDIILTERNMFPSREKAKASIMAGLIYVDGQRVDKPGTPVDREAEITIKESLCPYVSRGGLKLEKALDLYGFSLHDSIAVDIGASTGGFTDCGLQNGVKLSYALDVGYNQLAWKLRQDERVVVMERTNFRYVTPADLEGEMPNFASIDVSFISLTLLLPVLKTLLVSGSDVAALIKPQFEAGKEQVGKKGIVRDSKVHLQVINKIIDFSLALGFDVQHLTFSPITGGDGNIEFLVHLHWSGTKETGENQLATTAEAVVNEAHEQLKK